jgi:phospho-N-acetylmuramoyl-pentapeptide-transferase
MFYHLLYPLHEIDGLGFLNVFRYLTFRSAYAAITSLLVSFVVGPHLIHWLRESRLGQKIRPRARVAPGQGRHADDGRPPDPARDRAADAAVGRPHQSQHPARARCDARARRLGLLDDWLKWSRASSPGSGPLEAARPAPSAQPSRWCFCSFPAEHVPATVTTVPFLKFNYVDFGWLFVPFVMIVITGSSNAVNLTDGLDGLASGSWRSSR